MHLGPLNAVFKDSGQERKKQENQIVTNKYINSLGRVCVHTYQTEEISCSGLRKGEISGRRKEMEMLWHSQIFIKIPGFSVVGKWTRQKRTQWKAK